MTVLRELVARLGFEVDKSGFAAAEKGVAGIRKALGATDKAAAVAGKGANAASAAAASAAKKAEQAAVGAAGGMDKFLQLAASAGISQFMKSMVGMASDANETANVLDAVFGADGGNKVKQWSEEMGAAMGRSKYSLREYAGQLGAVLQPMLQNRERAEQMSTSFAGLAVDLGSFFNSTDEDALRALRSGLTGEYESLKRYGIVMNDVTLTDYAHTQGIKKKITAMSIAEKTELRYGFIMKTTVDAQGDAAKTGQGFANSSKALQAALKDLGTDMGMSVLPQIEKIIHFSRDALVKFKDFVHGTKILQAAMAVLAGTAAALAMSLAAPFILPALMLVALIAIIDDVGTALSGGRSLIGEWLDEWKGLGTTDSLVRELQEDLDDMHAFLPDFIGSWDIATGVIEDFGEALLYVLTLPLRGLYKLGDFLDKWVMFGWAEGKNYKPTGDQTSDWSSGGYENEQTYRRGIDSKATSGISDRQGLRRERRYARIRTESADRPRNRAERQAKREQERIDAMQSHDDPAAARAKRDQERADSLASHDVESEELGMSVAADPNAVRFGFARIRRPAAALRSDIAPPAGRSVNVSVAPTSVVIQSQSEDPAELARIVGKVIDDRNDALMSVIANPIHGG